MYRWEDIALIACKGVIRLPAAPKYCGRLEVNIKFKGANKMKIEQNQQCYQCELTKDEVLTMEELGGEYSVCESCLDLFLNGKIKFVDAHDVAE